MSWNIGFTTLAYVGLFVSCRSVPMFQVISIKVFLERFGLQGREGVSKK
jgi:hypothetical protein